MARSGHECCEDQRDHRPEDSGDELARRFAARAGAVDDQEGFEGFELLKLADERTTWLVVTRSRDEEAFQAWLNSPAFSHGHRSAAERGAATRPSRSACTVSCGPTRSLAVRPVPQVLTDPWAERDFLRGTQYKTDANLAAPQSIYAYQHPRIDLQVRVLDLAARSPRRTRSWTSGPRQRHLPGRHWPGARLRGPRPRRRPVPRHAYGGPPAAERDRRGRSRERTGRFNRAGGSGRRARQRRRDRAAAGRRRGRPGARARTCSTTCPTRLTRSASCAG